MNIRKEVNLQFSRLSRNILSQLSNLKFAILILLVIAALSSFGTIIEQNQNIEFYKENYPENKAIFGLLNWKIITFFNLDDVYRSRWYLCLLVLLGTSLTACSFTQQLPTLKISKRWRFLTKKQQLKNVDIKIQLDKINFSDVVYILNNETYNIFQRQNAMYCYKGIVGRIAPIFVHISIIQIFLGAILGAVLGYGGQEMIPKTETFHLQNIINSGYLSTTPIKKGVRVNNFWIDYAKDQNSTINQFYSDISLVDNKGEEIRRKVISVNNPLHYKDITLYQSDWDIVGIRGQEIKQKKNLQYEVKKIKTASGNRWLSQVKFSGKPDETKNILIKDLTKEVALYDQKGDYIKKIKEGDYFEIEENKFIFNEIIPATGIDIKSDPGIPFVYLGFVLLISSTLLSFISYSRVWIFKIKNNLYIGGSSNRAKISFEKYFLKKAGSMINEIIN